MDNVFDWIKPALDRLEMVFPSTEAYLGKMSKPEELKVGMPLKAKLLHRGAGENLETFLAFEPL